MDLHGNLTLPSLVAELHFELELYVGLHGRHSPSLAYFVIQVAEEIHDVIDIFDDQVERCSLTPHK